MELYLLTAAQNTKGATAEFDGSRRAAAAGEGSRGGGIARILMP
jgi:hypothetical protein